MENYLFFLILAIIIIGQIIIITFGSIAFNCYKYYGLRPIHWGISVNYIY